MCTLVAEVLFRFAIVILNLNLGQQAFPPAVGALNYNGFTIDQQPLHAGADFMLVELHILEGAVLDDHPKLTIFNIDAQEVSKL